jgi:hypothetical protein
MGGPGSGRKPKQLLDGKSERGREMDFAEIGNKLGLSHEGVRLIYLSAMSKLAARQELQDWLESLVGPQAITGRGVRRMASETEVELAKHVRVPPDVRHPYPDWSPTNTVVVSGPLPGFLFPGRAFPCRSSARKYWLARAGHIYEEFFVAGRYVFRVRRGTKETATEDSDTNNRGVPGAAQNSTGDDREHS